MQEGDEYLWDEGFEPLVVARLRVSVFGQPVCPRALYALIEAMDWLAWVQQRLTVVRFVPNGVLVRNPDEAFINHVLARL